MAPRLFVQKELRLNRTSTLVRHHHIPTVMPNKLFKYWLAILALLYSLTSLLGGDRVDDEMPKQHRFVGCICIRTRPIASIPATETLERAWLKGSEYMTMLRREQNRTCLMEGAVIDAYSTDLVDRHTSPPRTHLSGFHNCAQNTNGQTRTIFLVHFRSSEGLSFTDGGCCQVYRRIIIWRVRREARAVRCLESSNTAVNMPVHQFALHPGALIWTKAYDDMEHQSLGLTIILDENNAWDVSVRHVSSRTCPNEAQGNFNCFERGDLQVASFLFYSDDWCHRQAHISGIGQGPCLRPWELNWNLGVEDSKACSKGTSCSAGLNYHNNVTLHIIIEQVRIVCFTFIGQRLIWHHKD